MTRSSLAPRLFKIAAALLLLALPLVGYLHFSRHSDAVHFLSGSTMGTTWSIQLPAVPAGMSPDELATLLQRELDRLDRGVFSTWAPQSELSRFNRAAPGEDFAASPELIEVVLLAQEIHRLSGGAFDMTVGPLVDLWGFGPAPLAGDSPDRAEIAHAMALLGSDAVEALTREGLLRKRRAVRLDLSGVAKGYAVDRLAARLEELGASSYLVEIGGEIRGRGGRGEDQPWTLALESPLDGVRAPHLILAMPRQAFAAAGSGDYRNIRQQDGVRLSHELDPRTGRPIAHALAAVTVLDASAARADALATALMVLGPEEGLALAGGLHLPAYLIMRRDEGLESRQTVEFARQLEESRASTASQ